MLDLPLPRVIKTVNLLGPKNIEPLRAAMNTITHCDEENLSAIVIYFI